MRYELTDLRLFRAIAQAQSLSNGAAAVHITASAASYRLKNWSTRWARRCSCAARAAWS